MDSLRGTRRWLRIVWLAAAVAGSACSAPDRVETNAAASDDSRRGQLRERLRERLGDRYDAPLPATDMDQLRRGSVLYDQLCRSCHGPTGKGNGRSARMLTIQPPDLTDPITASFFSERAKLLIVAEGIAETPMIGWSRMLQEEEQVAVLRFMDTLVREPDSP
jgi:mono/diheme cytochrome c family protein